MAKQNDDLMKQYMQAVVGAQTKPPVYPTIKEGQLPIIVGDESIIQGYEPEGYGYPYHYPYYPYPPPSTGCPTGTIWSPCYKKCMPAGIARTSTNFTCM